MSKKLFEHNNGTSIERWTKKEEYIDLKSLPSDEKNRLLFERQKSLLDTFLTTGAIDKRQHDISLNCLREKMGFREE